MLAVYVLAVFQPFLSTNWLAFSWDAAVRRGDIAGLAMLVYIAVVWDPDTLSYGETFLGPELKNFLLLFATCTYFAGLAYLAQTRDPAFIKWDYALNAGLVLSAYYSVAACGIMFMRFRHSEASRQATP